MAASTTGSSEMQCRRILFDQFNRTRIGICLRDDEGTFVLAKTIPISTMCSISMGEDLALYYVMEWLSEMSFDNVDFAFDSKVIIDAFHRDRIDVTETSHIFSTC